MKRTWEMTLSVENRKYLFQGTFVSWDKLIELVKATEENWPQMTITIIVTPEVNEKKNQR